jgi:hypothetical protein
MGEFSHKEAHRLFWMVKGHLTSSEKTILESADGYFKRLWGNHENVYKEEGFEEAYKKLLDKRS